MVSLMLLLPFAIDCKQNNTNIIGENVRENEKKNVMNFESTTNDTST